MDNGHCNTDGNGLGVDYQDTIALLQAEVARLEEEVRLRDEALAERSNTPELLEHPEERNGSRQIAELTTELVERDELIALLLDEIRLVEEAEATSRAEWDQLNLWVEQVEQRVDSRDAEELNFKQEIASARLEANAQRLATETEKRAWERQRRVLEEEVERLKARLATEVRQSDPNAQDALAALERENSRLRKTCEQLTRATATTEEVERARAELRVMGTHHDETQILIRKLEDDMLRERNEHEAALATLRSQLAREPLSRNVNATGELVPAPRAANAEISVDERIRAFRQHLQQVHQQEVEERSNRRFSARLSRLWHRTGPSQ